MGLLNKLWSGLDFWDKKENQGQRQSFAQSDEEERKRKQQQAAQASVVRQPASNTPGLQSTNTVVKPISAGGQSDFSKPFDFTQPLQKNNGVQMPGVQPPQKVVPPMANPNQPNPAPTTPKPQVPVTAKPAPNPVEIRQKATAYQNPNVQDVNNYYGNDLKVLNEELAKGDNADLHRVTGLMQSLDNRKKELQTFHDTRGSSQSFKTARELGDHIKETRGDWTKQNKQLKQFWDGVSQNEKGDFEQFLAEKGQDPQHMDPQTLFAVSGAWKNGTGNNNMPDFTGDTEKVKEVRQRQQIADAMTDPKLINVPLDTLDGNKTTAMHLRDFKAASPEEQVAQLSNLEKVIQDNENNYAGNPDLKRKADQAFMLYNTLLDSGDQRSNFHTKLDKVGGTISHFGDALMESPKHVVQSVDALGREAFGGEQRGDELSRLHQEGKITDEQYNAELNKNTRDTAWAGDGSKGRGHDLLVAAGTSADTVATFLPMLSIAKAGKGALVAEKLAGQIAVEQGISRTAAREAAKLTLESIAKDTAVSSLKRTMAQEALINSGFSGVGSLRTGEFDPSKMATETVVGGVVGGVAPAVGEVLGKVGGRVLSKFSKTAEGDLPQAVEDVGRVTTRLGEQAGADTVTRASLMSTEEQARISQLEQLVDDPNMPSYQKLGYKQELQQLENQVDDKMAEAMGVKANDPLDTPAFIHKQDIEGVIADEEAKLQDTLAQPGLDDAAVEQAHLDAYNKALTRIQDLQSQRYSIANTPMNIPDPTSPLSLAKIEEALPNVPSKATEDAILPNSFDPAPLQKVADTSAATAEPPLVKADAPVANAQGNEVLTSDAQRASQLADQGMAPAVGASPVARGEQQLQAGAEQAARDQVNLAEPTTGAIASNRTAERVLASDNVPQETKDAVTALTHEVHNDKIMINAADSLVKNDINTARQMFDDMDLFTSGNLDGHVHLGNSLANEYNRLGQTAEAATVYNDLIAATSKIGQGLRAASAISKISPQSIVDFAARIASKNGKRLTPELEQELIQTAQEVAKMAPGEEKAAAIKQMLAMAQQPTSWDTAGSFIKGVLSAPRALMATGDLSFAVRQGGVLGSRYPKEWAEALKNSAKYAVSDETFKQGMADIANLTDANGEYLLPTFKKMGLSMNAVTGGAEEQFGNTSVLESKAAKKVGVGHIVAGSDRAFSGAAAEMRAKVAKKIIDGYGGVKGLAEWTDKDLSDLGKVLNTATGRGMGKEGGWFEKAAPTLSDTLFSARLWKSRLDLLNPLYYAKLAPAARKVALQSSASFAALVSATLGAAAAAGATVELDPRSSDFGKIKVGNTRYDIMGGLQQNIVLAARELTGSKKSADGSIVDLTEGGYGKPNRFTTLSDFVTNKETPVLATATRLMKGTDIAGNPVNPWTEVAKLFIPLGVQDVNALVQNNAGNGDGSATPAEALKNLTDPKAVAKAAGQASPGFVGVGVQTYGDSTAPKVGAGSGVDPTTLDPKALKKYEDNTNKAFVKTLSKDEQRAYNLSKDDKLEKLAIDKGTIKQSQIDAVLEKENQALQKAGLPTNEPKLDTKDAIQAHVENGEYGDAIKAIDKQIAANKKNKDIPKSKTDELVVDKKRLEVTDAGHYSPDIIKLYKDTSLSEWRAMADPESDQYDPEAAGKLKGYDDSLTKAGVSGGKKLTETKFYDKGARGGKGGGGSSKKGMTTSISTNKQDFANFTPQKAQSAGGGNTGSVIPTLQKVANYSRTLKKISTSKGGR